MTAQDAETGPDSQLLDRALPEITQLGGSLAGRREALRLALHSAELLDALTNLGQAVAGERGRLDAVDLIAPRMWAAEEFHSRIISWLLDPSKQHRQAGHFIAALLNATMAPPRLLDADWSAAQVLQEWENVDDGQWGYLDILVLDQDHRNLIAIENKTRSQEHTNQLTRYRRALADDYPDFTWHHIFVSPDGIPPYQERDREYWQPASYSVIHDAIRQVMETGIVADPDASALLQIYATTVRRNLMTDTSLDRQARRIYLEQWEAIERIYASRPKFIEETKPMLREAVAKHSFWKLDCEGARYVCFRAADWDGFPIGRTSPAPESNALLLFTFRFDNSEMPYLALEISPAGPGNAGIRSALFDDVRQNPAVFKPLHNSLIDGWMTLHQEREYILEPADYGPGWDDGTARRKIEGWVDKFAAEQFPEMNRIIVDGLRRHQED